MQVSLLGAYAAQWKVSLLFSENEDPQASVALCGELWLFLLTVCCLNGPALI